jgi:hypothetical protein
MWDLFFGHYPSPKKQIPVIQYHCQRHLEMKMFMCFCAWKWLARNPLPHRLQTPRQRTRIVTQCLRSLTCSFTSRSKVLRLFCLIAGKWYDEIYLYVLCSQSLIVRVDWKFCYWASSWVVFVSCLFMCFLNVSTVFLVSKVSCISHVRVEWFAMWFSNISIVWSLLLPESVL